MERSEELIAFCTEYNMQNIEQFNILYQKDNIVFELDDFINGYGTMLKVYYTCDKIPTDVLVMLYKRHYILYDFTYIGMKCCRFIVKTDRLKSMYRAKLLKELIS